MKNHIYCLFFLFSSFSFYGQKDSIPAIKNANVSVVSADKMNVVYRGVPNPISIAVPNVKSFTATGEGLTFEKGKYILRPRSGNEVVISVFFKNKKNILVTEKHTFKIKGLPSGFALINGSGCGRKCLVELSKEELIDAKISYEMPEFLFDPKINVTGFEISFIDSNLKKIGKNIEVQGNKINEKVYLEIKKTKNASFLIISDIHIEAEDLDLYICKISPIKVLISN